MKINLGDLSVNNVLDIAEDEELRIGIDEAIKTIDLLFMYYTAEGRLSINTIKNAIITIMKNNKEVQNADS